MIRHTSQPTVASTQKQPTYTTGGVIDAFKVNGVINKLVSILLCPLGLARSLLWHALSSDRTTSRPPRRA